MMRTKQDIGEWGERVAGAYLAARGVEIVARNVRTPYGEIDLIGRYRGELVFVEVKTRTNTRLGLPETSITDQKSAHLVDAAEHYLQTHPEDEVTWRIDLIAIVGRPGRSQPQIEWFENVVT